MPSAHCQQFITNIFNFDYFHFDRFSIQIKDVEALGLATIFRKVLLYHPPSKNLPPDLVLSMLQHMYKLTCTFAEASVREECVRIFICIHKHEIGS